MNRAMSSRPRRPGKRLRPVRTRLEVELLEARNMLSAPPRVIDVIGHLPVAEYNQFIRDAIDFQGNPDKNWGNQLTLAVNPVKRDQIALTTYAYGSAIRAGLGATRASIWYSADDGATWGIRFPIPVNPVPGAANRVPSDQTIAFDSSGVLHAAMLSGSATGDPAYKVDVFHGATANPDWDGINGRPETVWQWNPNRVNLPDETNNLADQPWLTLQGNRVFVGYDHFRSNFSAAEMRVSASADGGETFAPDHDNPVSAGGLVPLSANPGLRLATDRAGNVYSLFGLGDPPLQLDSGKPTEMHYRLNMSSDGGLTWRFTDASKKPGGLVVDDGLSLQFGSLFGGVNRLRGNITALAADPTGAHVYAVYGKEDDAGVDRIYLAEFHPDPGQGGLLVAAAGPVALSVPGERAALPSVAVTDDGAVGVMYDTFTPGDGQLHAHLAVSTNQGVTFADQDLYDFTPAGIPYPGDRLLGDYQSLVAVGKRLYGSFGGRGNTLDPVNAVDTTDKLVPFFFSVTVTVPRATGLAGALQGDGSATPSGSPSGATAGSSEGPTRLMSAQAPAASSLAVFLGASTAPVPAASGQAAAPPVRPEAPLPALPTTANGLSQAPLRHADGWATAHAPALDGFWVELDGNLFADALGDGLVLTGLRMGPG